jgi:uracil-DNA glycosylase family 4
VRGERPRPGEVARYLRQQGELAGPDLFLDDLSGQEVLRLAERAQSSMRDGKAPPLPGRGSSRGASASRPSSEYEALRAEALQCTRCDLSGTRTQVVFSDGNPRARLMVVGEAPGAREDETGMAFVGPAGKFLDLLLASVGLSRDTSAYICNVLKCRPPGNRNPLPGEIEACTPFLKRQIELISPDALLAVGAFAAQFLTGKEAAIGTLRGEVYSYQGVPLVVTYHPAALLRNASLTRPTWDDFQLLRQVMDGA